MNRQPHLLFLLVLLLASVLVLLSVQGQESGRTAAPGNLAAGLAVSRVLPGEPEISAHAFLVKVIGQEQPLLKRREWKPLPPASLSKLLTAVLAQEHLPNLAEILFSENAKRAQEDGEKMSEIRAGDVLIKKDALKLLLMSSANDAAVALAERLGGLEFFPQLANEKARIIGMTSSRFANPTGLDQDGHYATAQDLERLAEYIRRVHPAIWEITRAKEANITSGAGVTYKIENTNKLLAEFPAIGGSKTGFTDKAKGSLILIYPLKTGETAVIVILGSEDRFGDGRKIIRWLESVPN